MKSQIKLAEMTAVFKSRLSFTTLFIPSDQQMEE